MAHGIIARVPAPIDMYRAVNAAITARIGDSVPAGLLVHIARETPEGFEVFEVWDSKQHCDEFQDTVLAPVIEQVSAGQAPQRSDVTEEFAVENFFVGAAAVATASR